MRAESGDAPHGRQMFGDDLRKDRCRFLLACSESVASSCIVLNARQGFDLLSRVLLCVATLVAMVWGFTTYLDCIVIYRNKDNYRRETFVVTDAEFAQFPEGDVEYALEGTVAGQEERFTPRFPGRPRLRSKTDLLRAYPKGTKVDVMYNPDVSPFIANGGLLRMMPAETNFWENETKRRQRAAAITFAPISLALIFFFAVRHTNRSCQSGKTLT